MGVLVLAAVAALAAFQDLPSPAPSSPGEITVVLPPADLIGAPPAARESGRLLIPPTAAPAARKLLDESPSSGPGLSGFFAGSFLLVALLLGAFLLVRRFGRGSAFLNGGGAIKVLARKPLGQRQEIFLVEVGTKVFMVGSTRDHLTTLGEFGEPDEVAVLRSKLPERRDDSARIAFRDSLREGLKEEEAPAENRLFASIAGELAEIRKTVRAWRA